MSAFFSLSICKPLFRKRKNRDCPKSNGISVKTYATVCTRYLLILPLLTAIHSFYVHIPACLRAFRIAIKPHRNNYYNISNVPAGLEMNQMKWISVSQYFIDLFTNSTNCSNISYFRCVQLHELKLGFCLVLWRVYVRRIYGSITKDYKSDWSIQVTWKRGALSLVYSSTKVEKYSSCYLFLYLSGR